MSNAALATPPRRTHGAHERATAPVEIRVIPGGLLHEEARPRHSKAGLLDGMRGVGFGLSARERICAAAFGILFALAALAAIVYS